MISAASADLKSSASRLGSRLEQLESDLVPLRSEWTGEAAVAYQAAKAKWDAALGEMNELLNAIGLQVDSSGQEFVATDQSNAARFM